MSLQTSGDVAVEPASTTVLAKIAGVVLQQSGWLDQLARAASANCNGVIP